jgi:hypothetical protein
MPAEGGHLAAYKQSLADGRIRRHERAVLCNCVTGLEYRYHRGIARSRYQQGNRYRRALTSDRLPAMLQMRNERYAVWNK